MTLLYSMLTVSSEVAASSARQVTEKKQKTARISGVPPKHSLSLARGSSLRGFLLGNLSKFMLLFLARLVGKHVKES